MCTDAVDALETLLDAFGPDEPEVKADESHAFRAHPYRAMASSAMSHIGPRADTGDTHYDDWYDAPPRRPRGGAPREHASRRLAHVDAMKMEMYICLYGF